MISDASARTEALNPQASFIVQAPAGSGKTGLLVYRMLTLLATVENPQQVLAITFTRKATAEMRERLLELISRAQAGQSSDDAFEQQGIDLAWAVVQRDQQLGWNLLDSPHQLQILTIDAFCARLTTSMPWLSRLGDRPRTTDNADKHYGAAVEQLLSELLQDDSRLQRALKVVMLELDYDYNRARKLFASMLAKRDQWLRHILRHDLRALRANLEHTWQTIVAEQLAHLSGLFAQTRLQEIVDLAIEAASKIEPKAGAESDLKAFESFDKSIRLLGIPQWQALRIFLCGKGATIRKQVNKNIGFPPGSENRDRFKGILDEIRDDEALLIALLETDHIPAVQFADEDWQQLLALEEVLKSLAGLLQLQFRAAGECDHSEVTQRANLALQELDNPTDLALRMDYQIQHILVDEFQDTSHGQIELLKRLTSAWSPHDTGPAKTLFLVGDPMQSIYRFREADVSLFLRVAENANTQVFDNIDIRSLTLSENFRSSGSLVDWFNSAFSGSFPQQSDVLSGAIRYAEASSNKAAGPEPVAFHWASDKQHEAEQTIAAIAAAIRALPDADSKVALLVRGRGQLASLIPALQQAGIAYQGVDIRPLGDQQAVIDIVALCKAICREDDRVSWLGLLRGPWCGLELSELLALVGDREQTVWQQLNNAQRARIGSAGEQRLARFIDIMQSVMRQRQQVDLAALTRWAWKALGGEASMFGGSLVDINTVFNLIQQLQQGGDLASVAELDQAIAQLYAEPSGDPNARLVVSTMHKAKGLQYHTVILPALASPPGANSKEMMMWAEHQSSTGEAQLLLAPFRLAEEAGSHYQYLRELDKQRAKNEAIRLMYVACTRAEQQLVLLGKVAVNSDTDELKKPAANTLLATLWGAVEQGFSASYTNAEEAADSEQSQTSEYNQSLARLPADFIAHCGQPVAWQAATQLSAQDAQETDQVEYEWSTEVAAAVGVVMHDWLQFNQAELFNIQLSDQLLDQWRAELRALRVPSARLSFGLERLSLALTTMQQDKQAKFIFEDYPEQRNEYALARNEGGLVKTYRIDRTFVDQQGIRWIVDYKTTFTRNPDINEFIDTQVAERHRPQLEKYGALLQEIDQRPIKLAVYFPMLGQLRSWDFVKP